MDRRRIVVSLGLVGALAISACSNGVSDTPVSDEPLPTVVIQNSYADYGPSVRSMADIADTVVVGTLSEIRTDVWTHIDGEDPFPSEEVYDGAVFVVDRVAKGNVDVGDEVVVRYQTQVRDPETKRPEARVITDGWPFASDDLGSRFVLFLVEDPRSGLNVFVDERFAIAQILESGEVRSHFDPGPLNPWFAADGQGVRERRPWNAVESELSDVARDSGQLNRGW